MVAAAATGALLVGVGGARASDGNVGSPSTPSVCTFWFDDGTPIVDGDLPLRSLLYSRVTVRSDGNVFLVGLPSTLKPDLAEGRKSYPGWLVSRAYEDAPGAWRYCRAAMVNMSIEGQRVEHTAAAAGEPIDYSDIDDGISGLYPPE